MSTAKPYSSPRQALNKAFRIRPVGRDELEQFKAQLRLLLSRIDENESEENVKGHLADFLKDTGFKPDYLIATKDHKDLVIHTGPEADSAVGVIFEVKRPKNLNDMPTPYQLNSRAMHELMLYYLRERVLDGSNDIRRLVITNIYEWYIFDAHDFERLFGVNTLLAKRFRQWQAGQTSSASTEHFYNEIARPYLRNLKNDTLPFTYFNLKEHLKALNSTDPATDSSLIPLLKVFSPTHLLKHAFGNDSNSLNREFYHELLHIIGLEEVKEGGKRLIQRKQQPHEGSMLENTITILDSEVNLDRLPDLAKYGDSRAEQLYTLALSLCITWINRILFLKLLEAQLVNYHRNDTTKQFLRPDQIRDYDVLNKLFFQVLAKRPEDRPASVQKQFGFVPYLNSSLFEISELEEQTLRISSLDDSLVIPLYGHSVLGKNTPLNPPLFKGEEGNADAMGVRRAGGQVSTLHYLLSFLNAYNFASEGAEEVQEESKTLINASVLGLIFEKINGYKDGSFFTPGFITMYMCRETIRRAVVQRFNETYAWNCANFEELQDRVEYADKTVRQQTNQLINKLTICDPAVGSGHFLVSALNELIAIKADLRVLSYRDTGERVRGYDISIENDELVIIEQETGQPFAYRLNEKGQPITDRQRLQETLFHEKQTLIENCLFGVDINPNSVKICRLRLWIELLKHAYYRAWGKGPGAGGIGQEENAPSLPPALETLPNIDINIRQGNSLVSRYPLEAPFETAGLERRLNDYRSFIQEYKSNAEGERKRGLRQLLADIRSELVKQLPDEAKPLRDKLRKLEVELYQKYETGTLFGTSLTAAQQKDRARLEREIADTQQKIRLIVDNPLFRNAFEWRFQFPEVLDEAGTFAGFDVVIGNPPYIRQEEIKDSKPHLAQQYRTYAGTADLLVYFIEKGICLLKPGGHFSYIISNKFTRAGFGKPLRQWLRQWQLTELYDFGDLPVFDEATTYPLILSARKTAPTQPIRVANVQTLKFGSLAGYLNENAFQTAPAALNDDGWMLTDSAVHDLLEKIKRQGVPLGEYVQGKIYYGIKTGLNEAFVINDETRRRLIVEDPRSAEVIKPFLAGRDVKRYQVPRQGTYLILLPSGFTVRRYGKLPEAEAFARLKQDFPVISSYLEPFAEKARKRTDKGNYWWELRACDYYDEFSKPKLVFPDIAVAMQVCYLPKEAFFANTCYMIPCDDKYLLTVMNSSLMLFVYQSLSASIRGGYMRFFKQYVEQLPIKKLLPAPKKPFIEKVDAILSAKQQDPLADTSALEADLDQMVYALYGLTAEEVAIVEGR
ncbi:Eco57I restriction-modification methylase domain-containing protein [Nibrella saemangeumensis]|uniref:site-specific DNA-methyltransferase (adenine-specific) n=1 Tax=Nibrella saemangeumensis TaxID=1084526 RepID=A0ABP8MQH0_9BACT